MSDKFENDVYRSLGRVEARLAAISSSITEIKGAFEVNQRRLTKLERQHSLWRGAIAVLAPACAFAGAIVEKIFSGLIFWR